MYWLETECVRHVLLAHSVYEGIALLARPRCSVVVGVGDAQALIFHSLAVQTVPGGLWWALYACSVETMSAMHADTSFIQIYLVGSCADRCKAWSHTGSSIKFEPKAALNAFPVYIVVSIKALATMTVPDWVLWALTGDWLTNFCSLVPVVSISTLLISYATSTIPVCWCWTPCTSPRQYFKEILLANAF